MASVLSAAKQDPNVIRWLHSLDPERIVNHELLRSSVRYETKLSHDCKAMPGIPRETASLLIPMYVRQPFLLGTLHGPMSPNVLALAVLRKDQTPPTTTARRFVIDLSTANPVEFVEYEWMADGSLCVSMHEINETGLYSGQTVVFDGPKEDNSLVPSRVSMRLHFQELEDESNRKSLPSDWRDKPSSWETWAENFRWLRRGRTRIRATFMNSASSKGVEKLVSSLEEDCAIGEVGKSGTVANKLVRMWLMTQGMVVGEPAQDDPLVQASDQRMFTNTVAAHLYDEDSPVFSKPNDTVLEPEIMQQDDTQGEDPTTTAVNNNDSNNENMTVPTINNDPNIYIEPKSPERPLNDETQQNGLRMTTLQSQLSLLDTTTPSEPSLLTTLPGADKAAILAPSDTSLPLLGNVPHPQRQQPPIYSKLPATYLIPDRRLDMGQTQGVFGTPTHSLAPSLSSKAPSSVPSGRGIGPLLDAMDDSTSTPFPMKRKEPAENSSSAASRSEHSDSRMDVKTSLLSKQLPEDAFMAPASPNIIGTCNVSLASITLRNNIPHSQSPPLNTQALQSRTARMVMPTSFQTAPVSVPVPQHFNQESPDSLDFALRPTPPLSRKLLQGNGVSNANLPLHGVTRAASRLSVPQNTISQDAPSMTTSLGTELAPAPARRPPASASMPSLNAPAPNASVHRPTQAVPTRIATQVPAGNDSLHAAMKYANNLSTIERGQEDGKLSAGSSADKKDLEKRNSVSGGINKPGTRGPGGGREHVCQECGKKFSHRGHFNQHVRAVHEKMRKYKCTYKGCTKAFAKRGDLMRHQMSQHTDGVRYPCTRCGVTFADKAKLAMHFAEVHDEDKPFKCTHCTRGYSTRSGLRKHMNAKHPGASGSAGANVGAGGGPGVGAGADVRSNGVNGVAHEANMGVANGGWATVAANSGGTSADTAVK